MPTRDAGHPERVGLGFDAFDGNLPRNVGARFDKLFIALNFWDGWIDARNHDWEYYDPIQARDWPVLARSIAERIEADAEVTDTRVLRKFDFRKQA